MLDYQRIIEDVRNSLYATGPDAAETVRSAGAAFTLACQDVNERLRRCGQLLNAGLRSEALQQAEIEPNLLDVVAALDFPERELWGQFAAEMGIAAPAMLLDVAADLNEAYSVEQPLVALLAKHRLHALARSPLRQRIKTLREIAETDSNNPIWQDDLHLYEQERLKQIQREAGDCLESSDLETARSLVQELQDTPWTESPADALFDRLSGTLQKLISRNACRELDQIDSEMNAAYSAFEIDKMRGLRDRWLQALPQSGMGEESPISQRVAPALEWLANYDSKEQQQRDHIAALATLEKALDDDKTTAIHLERKLRIATKHGDEVPVELDRRVQARLSDMQLAVKRRMRLWIGSATVAMCVVATIIGVAMFQHFRAAEIANHSSALAKFIEESKLEEAQQYVERLTNDSPKLAAAAPIQSLSIRLNSLLHDDETRREHLESLLEQARSSLSDIKDWTVQILTVKYLDEAAKTAKSDSEKAAVRRLQMELSEKTRDLQRREDAIFTPQLDRLAEQVQRVRNLDLDLKGRQAEILRLKSEIRELQSRGGHVTPALYEQSEPLLVRLKALDEDIKNRQRQESAALVVTQAIGNDDAFLAAIDHYIKEFPDSARSADFRRVVEEAPLWKMMPTYTALADKWANVDHTAIGSQTAKEQIDAANAGFKVSPEFPGAADFRARLPYLEAIARRSTGSDDSLVNRLRANYSKPWISDLAMIQLNNGDRFYVRVIPDADNEHALSRARYVVDFDLTEKPFPASSRNDVARIERSPQAVWAEGARRQVSELADDKWESAMYGLLTSIYENKEIDPLPRLTLMRQTLEAACEGSLPFQRAFKSQVAAVNDPSIDPFANWLDPKDEKVKAARNKAEAILNDLPDLKISAANASQDWKSLRRPVGHRYIFVGWLSRDTAGKWQCMHRESTPADGKLMVIFKSASDGKPKLETVGNVEKGEYRIASGAQDKMLEGRPVFLAAPPLENSLTSSR